jgi:K+-transporting ATPase ATPase A chain
VTVPVLAIAGALGRKGFTPPSAGTLPTHGVQFALVLISVVLIISALSFLPALALGPIVEQLMMGSP